MSEGRQVRVLTRAPGSDPTVRWIQGDLATSEGIAEAVAGADTVVEHDGHRGERMDFAGPEALTLREMAEQHAASRGIEKRIRELPLPRRVERALTTGNTSPSGHRGTTTWPEWLERPAAEQAARIAA